MNGLNPFVKADVPPVGSPSVKVDKKYSDLFIRRYTLCVLNRWNIEISIRLSCGESREYFIWIGIVGQRRHSANAIVDD